MTIGLDQSFSLQRDEIYICSWLMALRFDPEGHQVNNKMHLRNRHTHGNAD